MRPSNKITQIAKLFPLDESLILHPEIVEKFGQVFVAGIARERNDSLRFSLLTTIFERCGQTCARRGTCQDTFHS